MAKKPDGPVKPTGLRWQAEELLRTTKRDVTAMPVKDVPQLVHELQVHQVELEMQNEELRRSQMELEAARDRYVGLYDFSPAGHLTLDRDGTIVEASLRAGMLLGLNRNELIEQPLTRFVAAEDQDRLYRHVQEVLKTGTRQNCAIHIRKKAGAADVVYLESLAVHEEPGHITHWRTSLLDISDRKRAEQELETQRSQLDAIIGSAMDAIITVDEQEHTVLFNRAAESMFGCRAAEAIGQPLDRFIPERFREAHHGHMSRFAKSGGPSRAMQREGILFGLRANGEEFPIEASISRVLVAGKRLFTVILRDVTERVLAGRVLEEHNVLLREKQNELESLAEKLIEAQDSERQRIARDLHDDFSQRLVALVLDVAALQRHPPRVPELLGNALELVREELTQLSDDLHSLAYRLHPPLLQHAGLQPTIEDYISKAIERTGLDIVLKVKDFPGAIPFDWSTGLFRVFQESLQNVVKHAKATAVLVKLSGSSKGVGLSVIDNGKGFDERAKSSHQKGLGLISMRERLRLLNGFLNIHSRPADGTKVCACIPFQEQTP